MSETTPSAPAGRGAGVPPAGAAGAPDHGTSVLTVDGRQLRVSATLEPVYEVKGFSRIGFRMIRRIMARRGDLEAELAPPQLAQLSTADILRVDLATISRGIGRLRSDAEKQLSLTIPISYTSLSNPKSRTEVVERLKEAGRLTKLGVICEMIDVEGVASAAVRAAAAFVRPFTLLVVGRVDDGSARAILRLEGAGLQALSFDCPVDLADSDFQAWGAQTMTAARRVAKSVLVYGADNPARAATLASLGATHVSVGAARP